MVQAWRKKVAHGDVIVLRYLDDAVNVAAGELGAISAETPGAPGETPY